jgi:Transposase DDE domain group 1
MADATGEAKAPPLRVAFDRRLKLEFHGTRITSDGGLLAYRELDDALDLTTTGMSALAERRRGKNTRHQLLGLLRQAIYGRLAGYEGVNDAERLAHDPAMRAIVGREGLDRPAASTSQMGRFETEWLATETNLAALTDLSGAWIDRVHRRRPPDGVILDMDSSESPTWGEQEGSAWNGHFRCTCYHPLFVFNQFGDLERCVLRPGNVHSAEGWRSVLEPVIDRYHGRGLALYFRGDAAFAEPELYELLEAEGIAYATRLPANAVLQERIGHLLTRPVGRPPKKPQVFHASFAYQAQGWGKPRRVVVKVEWHQGELVWGFRRQALNSNAVPPPASGSRGDHGSGTTIRGEPAIGRAHRATRLYSVDPCRIRTMMQPCASAARLRGGGPILYLGSASHSRPRVTATSDLHRRPVVATATSREAVRSRSAPGRPLTRPGAGRRLRASRRS